MDNRVSNEIFLIPHEGDMVNAQIANVDLLKEVLADLKKQLNDLPDEAWNDESTTRMRALTIKQIKEVSLALSRGIQVAFKHINDTKNNGLKQLIFNRLKNQGNLKSNFNALPLAKAE